MSSDGQVIDNRARHRFELALPGGGTAFIAYYYRNGGAAGTYGAEPRAAADAAADAANVAADATTARAATRVCVLTHAEVPAGRRGLGIGARLTAGALELLRARGEKAVPACPYVADFIRRHPQYADVVAG